MLTHQMYRICRGLDLIAKRSLPSTASLKTTYSVSISECNVQPLDPFFHVMGMILVDVLQQI